MDIFSDGELRESCRAELQLALLVLSWFLSLFGCAAFQSRAAEGRKCTSSKSKRFAAGLLNRPCSASAVGDDRGSDSASGYAQIAHGLVLAHEVSAHLCQFAIASNVGGVITL